MQSELFLHGNKAMQGGISIIDGRDLDSRGYEVFLTQTEPGLNTLNSLNAYSKANLLTNPEVALQCTSILSAVRVIAETIAILPLHVYKRAPEKRDRHPDHPLYPLLHNSPNTSMSAFTFVETLTAWACLWGNAYAEVVKVRGKVQALMPLHPSRMVVDRLVTGQVRYRYTEPDGTMTYYDQTQILHIKWLSNDGIMGLMPVGLGADAIKLARACENTGIAYFSNGARPGVVLETEHSIPPEAQERIREAWERVHKGSSNAGRTAILPNGLKAHELGLSNVDNQFLELRTFQINEVSRIYRIPPHMLGELSRSTFSNIESQGLEFLNNCMTPWIRRWESALYMALFADDPESFAEFDTRGLLRGDSASRASFFQTTMSLGIYSLNEVRDIENLPPVEGGDTRFITRNLQTLETAMKPPAPPGAVGEVKPKGLPAPEDAKPEPAEPPAGKEARQAILDSISHDPRVRDAIAHILDAAEARDCGTGKGGFKPGNTCAKGGEGQLLSSTDDSAGFLAARNSSSRPENHSEHTTEYLDSCQKFLTPDGKCGYIINADGDFGNLFNNGSVKGAGKTAIAEAIENGARTLDCYDGFLPKLYAEYGWEPVAKIKFNDEYAPAGWDYDKLGRPDIVIMAYQGGDRATIKERAGSFPAYEPPKEYSDDFDKAKELARSVSQPAERSSRADEEARGGAGRGVRAGELRGSQSATGVHREPVAKRDCGTGKGGFKPGNNCAAGGDGIADGSTLDASDEAADENSKNFDWSASKSALPPDSEERKAISHYASGGNEANGVFRYGETEESLKEYADNLGSTPEQMRAIAGATERAVNAVAAAANPEQKEQVTYRGVRTTGRHKEYGEALRNLAVGDILKEAGLMSTSASLRSAAVGFTSREDGLIIRVKGVSGAPISGLANWSDEHEVLYPNKSKFVVTGVARNVTLSLGEDNEFKNVTVIDAMEKR